MFELIKAALKKAGLAEGLHTYIKVEKEEEIDAAVTAFKALMPKVETPAKQTLAEMIAADPAAKADYDLALQKEGDRRVSTKKMKDTTGGEGAGEGDLTDDEKRIKAIVGPMFDEVKKTLAGITTMNAVNVKKAEAGELLKKAGIAEGTAMTAALGMVNYESEITVADQVTGISGLITQQTQKLNDQLLKAGITPGEGTPDGVTVAETTIKAAAEQKNAELGGENKGGFHQKSI